MRIVRPSQALTPHSSLLPLSRASSLPHLRRAYALPSAEDVHELEGPAELLVEADERRHFGVGVERLLGQRELYTEERGGQADSID